MPSLPPRKQGQFCSFGSQQWVAVLLSGFEIAISGQQRATATYDGFSLVTTHFVHKQKKK